MCVFAKVLLAHRPVWKIKLSITDLIVKVTISLNNAAVIHFSGHNNVGKIIALSISKLLVIYNTVVPGLPKHVNVIID